MPFACALTVALVAQLVATPAADTAAPGASDLEGERPPAVERSAGAEIAAPPEPRAPADSTAGAPDPQPAAPAGVAAALTQVQPEPALAPKQSVPVVPDLERRNSIDVSLRGAAGAGINILPPMPFATLGAGVGMHYERRFWGKGLLGARLSFDLGSASRDGLIGGYLGDLELGIAWVDASWFKLQSLIVGGVEGWNMFPFFLLSMAHELAFVPVHASWVRWKLGLGIEGYLLTFTPAAAGEAFSKLSIGPESFAVALKTSAGWKIGLLPGLRFGVSAQLSGEWAF